ncbi:MAG: hypothetical protein GY940_21025 [bacterium]|nr:hypothetical protein [bacterium]
MARAYTKNGHLEKAAQAYEKITSLTFGRLEDGDIYAKSFYHLGKIYQQKGWKGKAIENYRKFIELWKEFDPQYRPLLEDAKSQVDQLEDKL